MGGSRWSRRVPTGMLAWTVWCLCLSVGTDGRPQSHIQTWNLRHSTQVAQPIVVHSEPFDKSGPIPFFPLPAASRRQDHLAGSGFQLTTLNGLQGEGPQVVHVQPGDTVSLVVRAKNQQQQFVDVGSLLSALQSVPPSSDGAHHVFLAPPDYPVPPGAQRFHVTYVTPAQSQAPSGASHPPLFVAPLDYNVPHGYSRVQIPTRHVKFTTNPNGPNLINVPRQPAPTPPPTAPPTTTAPLVFRQAAPVPPAAPVFRPVVPVPAAPAAPAAPVFRQPAPVFTTPAPIIFGQAPVPAPVQAPAVQPAVPAQPPSLFDQALASLSPQTGFIPSQGLDEAPQEPQRKEPLVLAMESPAFLEPDTPAEPGPAVVATPETSEPESEPVHQETTSAPVQEGQIEPAVEEAKAAPEVPVVTEPAVQEATTAEPVEKAADAPVEAAPVEAAPVAQSPAEAEPAPVEAPVEIAVAAEPAQEEPAVKVESSEAPVVESQSQESKEVVPEKEDKKKKASSSEVTKTAAASSEDSAEGSRPLFPDFQSARRQQINRQQNGGASGKSRTKIRVSPAGTTAASAGAGAAPTSFNEAPALQFGQKLRPAIKTNALVSPPVPVPSTVVQFETSDESADDPPVVDRDDAFQTLESQNAASAVNTNRGRVRFQKTGTGQSSAEENQQSPINAIPSVPRTPAPAPTPVRRPVSGGGRGRIRLTTAAPVTTTGAEESQEDEEPEDVSTVRTVTTEAPSEEAEESSEAAEEPVVGAEEALVAAQQAAVVAEEPAAEEEEDLIKLLAPKEEAAVQVAKTADRLQAQSETKEPWSPYEAVRQMQTVEEKRTGQKGHSAESAERVITRPGSPGTRIRGRIRGDQLINRPVGNRPAANRPLTTVIRKKPISRPINIIPDRDPEEIRLLRVGSTPADPGFGVRASGQNGQVALPAANTGALSSPSFPSGRRVPEIRPAPGIRITRPALTVVSTEEDTNDPQELEGPEPQSEEVHDVQDGDDDEEEVQDEEEDSIAEGSRKELASTTAVPTTTESAAEPEDQETEEESQVEDETREEPDEPAHSDVVTEEAVSTTTLPTTTTAPSGTTESAEEDPEAPLDIDETAAEVAVEQESEEAAAEVAVDNEAAEPAVVAEVAEPAETVNEDDNAAGVERSTTESAAESVSEPSAIESPVNSVDNSVSERNGKDQKVLGVSTATEVSLMYELCFRGHCIKVHE